MRAGDTIYPVIQRRTVANVAAAAGLAIGDFIVDGYLDGVATSFTPSLAADLGVSGKWRRYKLGLVLPGSGLQQVMVQPRYGSDIIGLGNLGPFEVEGQDLDSIYSSFAVPLVSVVDSGGPQGDVNFRVVKSTYAPLKFTAKDQAGNAFDLSGWDTPILAIKSKDQATTYSLAAGITMTAAGLVTIGFPEAAAIYSALTSGLAQDPGQVVLYYTFVANEATDATKTRCLARGTFTIVRTEV